jgi:hypothetical protein
MPHSDQLPNAQTPSKATSDDIFAALHALEVAVERLEGIIAKDAPAPQSDEADKAA